MCPPKPKQTKLQQTRCWSGRTSQGSGSRAAWLGASVTTGSEAADSCKTNMCLGGVPVASKIPTQWKRLRKGPLASHASRGKHGVEFGPARDIFSEIVSCIFNSVLKYPGDYFKQLLLRCPHLMVGHRNQGEARSRKTVSEAASGSSLIPPFGACPLLGTLTNGTECHRCYGNTQEVFPPGDLTHPCLNPKCSRSYNTTSVPFLSFP